LIVELRLERFPNKTTKPRAPNERIARTVVVLDINLGKHCTIKSQRKPIPKAIAKLIRIQS
jgi:hypothetical protein